MTRRNWFKTAVASLGALFVPGGSRPAASPPPERFVPYCRRTNGDEWLWLPEKEAAWLNQVLPLATTAAQEHQTRLLAAWGPAGDERPGKEIRWEAAYLRSRFLHPTPPAATQMTEAEPVCVTTGPALVCACGAYRLRWDTEPEFGYPQFRGSNPPTGGEDDGDP